MPAVAKPMPKRVVKQRKAAPAKRVKQAPGTAKPAARAVKPAAPRTRPAPTKANKPARPTRPSLPLPPPAPAPPPVRDELAAPRDIARLLRYGERFGETKIDIRMLPLQLPVASGLVAIGDPAAPKSWRVLDRPATAGAFRVMLSIARRGTDEQLAALVIHVGRPPITRWTVAHPRGQNRPRTADEIPRCEISSGWIAVLDAGSGGAPGALAVPATSGITPVEIPLIDGRRALALPCGTGAFAAYWGIDATDKPVCLVVDFDVFTQKDWKAKPTS